MSDDKKMIIKILSYDTLGMRTQQAAWVSETDSVIVTTPDINENKSCMIQWLFHI